MKKFATFAMITAGLAATQGLPANGDTFDGFRLGGEVALQRSEAKVVAPGSVRLSDTDKGFNIRAFAAYDMHVSDNFVLGGEVGIGRGGPKVKASNGTASFTADPGLTLDASVRAGLLPAENMLIYGRLGYASSKVDITAANTGATPPTFSRNKREGGLLWGIGAEMAIGESTGVRAEYRRAKFGDLKSDQMAIGAYLRF